MKTLAHQPTTMRSAFEDAGYPIKSKAGLKPVKQFWMVTHNGQRVIRKRKRVRQS